MDQKKVNRTARRMSEARALILRDNPFFGHLAMRLSLACAPCGTACTDGSRLIFDPDFAEKLSDQEMQFVILHELLHCVLDHCTRGRGLQSKLYNIACDIVVNSTILAMWGLKTITIAGEEAMHLAPDGKEGRAYNAEEVYHMLLKKMPAGKDFAKDGSGFDRHDLWQGICDETMLEDTWNQNIRSASGECGNASAITKNVRDIVEELAKRSGADWRQLLHDFIQHDTYDYSFTPPDRRYSSYDFCLPAYNIDEDNGSAADLWICVDTSGSITDEILASAMAEILDAMRQAGLRGWISFFDDEISEPVGFESETEIKKMKPVGNGGTSFKIIFSYLRERMSQDLPKAILIFTDGYAEWPKESDAMGVPVLWLISKGGCDHVPWGRVARL